MTAISKGSSMDKNVMHLLRCMWLFVAYFDINLHAKHITGVSSTATDQLPRNFYATLPLFPPLTPQVSLLPPPLPPLLLETVSFPKLDWRSTHFSMLFRDTITWA